MTTPTYTPRAGSLITRSPVRGLASAADLAPAQKTSSPAPAASASACTTGMGG